VLNAGQHDFRRLGHRPLKTGFRAIDEALDGVGLAYPAVLELVGHSGSGKTEFFLNICAVNILPENFEGVFLGGVLCFFKRRRLPSHNLPLQKLMMGCGWVAGPGQSFVYFCVGMIPSTMITRLITLLDVVLAQACPQVLCVRWLAAMHVWIPALVALFCRLLCIRLLFPAEFYTDQTVGVIIVDVSRGREQRGKDPT
jgi:hypothetical protein